VQITWAGIGLPLGQHTVFDLGVRLTQFPANYTATMSSALALRSLRSSLRSQSVWQKSFHTTLRRQQHFLDADAETFEKAISNEDKVVLVDFYADWCNPCKMLSPILEKVTTDPEVKSGSGLPLDLVTVDTDTQVELAQKYNIRSLPTVMAFREGQPIHRFVGALPEAQVRAFLRAV